MAGCWFAACVEEVQKLGIRIEKNAIAIGEKKNYINSNSNEFEFVFYVPVFISAFKPFILLSFTKGLFCSRFGKIKLILHHR